MFKTKSISTILILATFLSVGFLFFPNSAQVAVLRVKNTQSGTSWLTGWTYRKKITISKTNVASDLSTFPLLVKIAEAGGGSSNIGAHSRSDGYDIRFTSSDGTTILPYERETFSVTSSNLTANIWVKVPTITTASNTDIYIYYTNASATTDWTAATSTLTNCTSITNAQCVWKEGASQNFAGVWHLKETGGPFSDSTSNSYNTTGGTYPSQTDAEVGKGQSYNGSTNYVEAASNGYGKFNSQSFTISQWIKTPSSWGGTTTYRPIWSYDYTSHSSPYYAQDIRFSSGSGGDEGKLLFGWNNGSTYQYLLSPSAIGTSSWHYITTVFTSGRQEIWDNTSIVANNNRADTITYYNQPVWWDRTNFVNPGSDFYQDEVRFSSTARSADWVKFEYYNMSSSTNELTFASQEFKSSNSPFLRFLKSIIRIKLM